MHFHPTGRKARHGKLEITSLAELRTRTKSLPVVEEPSQMRELVADVTHLHQHPSNSAALFQVASQFNLLEMVSPEITPEDGVDGYDCDYTQGPACAIACGAGTIYRNYFVPIDGKRGQCRSRQIDCLRELGQALGNKDNTLWHMVNGYALPTRAGLQQIHDHLLTKSNQELDYLRSLLQVGIQWDTEVTLSNSKHCVSQVYCSALPVAYSALPNQLWEPFARLILEAAYEATLLAGRVNNHLNYQDKVYLTLLGGGAFGNQPEWIFDALRRAYRLNRNSGLDIQVVSYGQSNPDLKIALSEP
ncbi:hypothetical protein [Rubritalea squalenifaciens]|nr:hypothetical protein [Rubritalea squalenifaciens]